MFSIYAPSGRVFSGPLEQLRRIEKTAATRFRKVSLEDEDEDNSLYYATDKSYGPSNNKLAQYKESLRSKGQREPVYHAYQIMTSSIHVLMSDWNLTKAVEQFKKHPYQALPIVNSRRQLIGVLSRQKLYEFLLSTDQKSISINKTIEQCFLTAESQIYSADPVTDIRRIATLLVEESLSVLPIVEDTGRLVGIVSRTDILRSVIADPPLSLWC